MSGCFVLKHGAHWLDVPDRVTSKLGVTMSRHLHDQAPLYLIEYCRPVSDIAPRQRVRSVNCHFLEYRVTS